MLKKWIIIVSIIVSLIVGCCLESKFVNGAFDEMTQDLAVYQQMLEATEENINIEQNVEYLENLHNKFHQKEKVLKSLIWHTGLKDVEVSISRILTYTEENDYTEALTETNALLDYCKHYSQDFSISLENIF